MYTTKRLWQNFLKPGAIYQYFEEDNYTLYTIQVWLLFLFVGLMLAGLAAPLLAYWVTPLAPPVLVTIGGYAILAQIIYYSLTLLIGGIAFAFSYQAVLSALAFLPNRILAVSLEFILCTIKCVLIVLFTAPADGIDFLFSATFSKYNSVMGKLWGKPQASGKDYPPPYRWDLFNYVTTHYDPIWLTIFLILLLGTLGSWAIPGIPVIIFSTMQTISLHCLLYFLIAGFVGNVKDCIPDRGFTVLLLLPNWIIGILAELNLLVIKLALTPFVAIIDLIAAPMMEIQQDCLNFDELAAMEMMIDTEHHSLHSPSAGSSGKTDKLSSTSQSPLANMHLLAPAKGHEKDATADQKPHSIAETPGSFHTLGVA